MSGWLIAGGAVLLVIVALLAIAVIHGAELAERRERVLRGEHDRDMRLFDDGKWDGGWK